MAEMGDENVHYLDGLEVFGAKMAGYLPDGVHPNGDGYERLGENFSRVVLERLLG